MFSYYKGSGWRDETGSFVFVTFNDSGFFTGRVAVKYVTEKRSAFYKLYVHELENSTHYLSSLFEKDGFHNVTLYNYDAVQPDDAFLQQIVDALPEKRVRLYNFDRIPFLRGLACCGTDDGLCERSATCWVQHDSLRECVLLGTCCDTCLVWWRAKNKSWGGVIPWIPAIPIVVDTKYETCYRHCDVAWVKDE